MPRSNLQAERKTQILEAMSRCVAKFGLRGMTLENMAKEAGLARALLRHNIGNREALISEFIDHYFAETDMRINSLFDQLPASNQSYTLIKWLFDPDYADPETVLIAEALIAAGADDPKLQVIMKPWIIDFIGKVASVLRHDFPNAEGTKLKAVASGITGIYFNVASMSPLGDIQDLREPSEAAATMLIDTLKS